MPTFNLTDKHYIDITHEDEWEVDFTVHTPVLSFSARQFEPTFPNANLAGRREVMLSGFVPDHFKSTEAIQALADYLQLAQNLITAIGAMGPKAFLAANRDLVRR